MYTTPDSSLEKYSLFSETVTEESEMHPSKAEVVQDAKPLPIVTLVSPVQPLNAESPMLVTLSGIVMFSSHIQP